MEPLSLPSAHNVDDKQQQRRAEMAARNKEWKRTTVSAARAARATPNANDPELARWYALGGRARVVFDPNVPLPG